MKTIILQILYRVLSHLSLYIHSTRINQYKLAIGSSLLLLSTGVHAQKKEKQDSLQGMVEQVPTEKNDSSLLFCYVIEEMPEYPDGMEALLQYLKEQTTLYYPQKAKEEGVEGRVIVRFVVKKDGRIDDVKVVRSIDPSLDEVAIKVVEGMPKWRPGKMRGIPKQTKYTIPVTFKLTP